MRTADVLAPQNQFIATRFHRLVNNDIQRGTDRATVYAWCLQNWLPAGNA